VPSFEDFGYFFLLEVIGISKFMFSVIMLVGMVCGLIGTAIYKAFGRATDTRVMIIYATIAVCFGSFLNVVLVKRWNLEIGISDYALIFFTDVLVGISQVVLFSIPLMALFAKITPKRIEGTTYALLTSVLNLSFSILSPNMGTAINHRFVGVSADDLSSYDTLVLITLFGSLLSLVLVFLIPTNAQVREFRDIRELEYAEIKQKRRDRRREKARARGLLNEDEEELLE
jgi:Na+/melibiose symporter-like transporter